MYFRRSRKNANDSSTRTQIDGLRTLFRCKQDVSLYENQRGTIHRTSQGIVARHDSEGAWLAIDEKRRRNEEMGREAEAVRAIFAQYKDDHEQVISELRQYIETYPNSDSAYSYLGIAFRLAQRWEESLAAYREAERLAGTESWSGIFTRLSIGDVLQKKGDLSAAARKYERITDDARLASIRHEDFPWGLSELAYLYLGKVLQAQGKRRKARAMWKRIVLSSISGAEARKLLEASL